MNNCAGGYVRCALAVPRRESGLSFPVALSLEFALAVLLLQALGGFLCLSLLHCLAASSCALAAASIFAMSGAYWLGGGVPGRRTISSSVFTSVRSRSGSSAELVRSQLAKLLAQILGLDAVVGCFLALLDGLLAVETAGDDLGHLGEAIAGQGGIQPLNTRLRRSRAWRSIGSAVLAIF